jgi:hypothetical protein
MMNRKIVLKIASGCVIVLLVIIISACNGKKDNVSTKNSINYEAQLNPNFKNIIKETEDHLKSTANAASTFLTVEELDRFHTAEEAKEKSYHELKMKLAQFAQENNVIYVSYLRQYDENNLQYIIDNDFEPKTLVGPETIIPIDDIERVALAGKAGISDLNIYIKSAKRMSWNELISGIAPVFNSNGSVYCIVVVDISEGEFIQKLYQK